jgi:aminoglycoside phosphotransferase (APT) family kinase protein
MRVDPVDVLLARHGVAGRWHRLTTTGVANRVYATPDVVLRVATDHPDAISDARTESVAAPVARAAGLPVPRLIAFDDSRSLLDRPYSIWERIHAETLGLLASDPHVIADTWRAVGRALAFLHGAVTTCDDPQGWLDRPERLPHEDLRALAESAASRLGRDGTREILRWIDATEAARAVPTQRCFLHYDVHAMNIMCSRNGQLRALIDWGDAGWGDPVLEFSQVDLWAVPVVLEAYRGSAAGWLGDVPEARILADHLWCGLEDLLEGDPARLNLPELRRYVATHEHLWL